MSNYPDNFSQEAFERQWGGVSEKHRPYDLEPLPRVRSTREQTAFAKAIKETEDFEEEISAQIAEEKSPELWD